MEDEEYFKQLKDRGKGKSAAKPKKKSKEPKRPVKPYGFYAFKHLTPVFGWFYLAVILLMLSIAAIALKMFDITFGLDDSIYLLSIGVALGISCIIGIWVFITYLKFKGWKERLPFDITGVENFLAYQRMPDITNSIRYVSISVTLKGNEKKHQVIVDDALKIIVNHFEPINHKGGTGEWVVVEKLAIKGPANYTGMRWILKFISNDFVEIHNRVHCIEKVHFTTHSKTIRIKPNRQDRIIIPD